MIVRATAIPLAIFPYSSTSTIVHWLTRQHGKVSTLLKGAFRPKSPFLGEYELFSTSELLYFNKHTQSLYAGKECSMMHRRPAFRSDWRSMQAASYITALFRHTTPDDAPQPELFSLYEDLLDLAEKYGRSIQFIIWSELRFCDLHGHLPNLGSCIVCNADNHLKFCASLGGVVCASCAREKQLPTLGISGDSLQTLRAWQHAESPDNAIADTGKGHLLNEINAILGTFMMYHFNLQPEHRNTLLQAA